MYINEPKTQLFVVEQVPPDIPSTNAIHPPKKMETHTCSKYIIYIYILPPATTHASMRACSKVALAAPYSKCQHTRNHRKSRRRPGGNVTNNNTSEGYQSDKQDQTFYTVTSPVVDHHLPLFQHCAPLKRPATSSKAHNSQATSIPNVNNVNILTPTCR